MRQYWMAQIRHGGLTELRFCETRQEAEKVVAAAKQSGGQASYWEL